MTNAELFKWFEIKTGPISEHERTVLNKMINQLGAKEAQEYIQKGLAKRRYRFDFEAARKLFGKYSQDQVDSINLLIHTMSDYGCSVEQAAYLFATTYHETAHTMLPIVEYGPRRYFGKYDTGRLAKRLGNTPEADGDGFKYRGRGFVQITGLANYDRFSKLLDIDLIGNPDLALMPDYAAQILVIGSMRGLFTGKKVSDYINDQKCDFVNCRRVINGRDKAGLIAGYAEQFKQWIVDDKA